MLDKVIALTASANKARIGDEGTSTSKNEMLIHHSRDSEHKQWAETYTATIQTIVKITVVQHKCLTSLGKLHYGDLYSNNAVRRLRSRVDDIAEVHRGGGFA